MNQPSLMDQWDLVRQRERGDAEVDPASEAMFDAITPGTGFFDTLAAKVLAGGTGMAILGRLPTKAELKTKGKLQELFQNYGKRDIDSVMAEGQHYKQEYLPFDQRRDSTQWTTTVAKTPQDAQPDPHLAATEAASALSAENDLLSFLRGKKRFNPRELEEMPASVLDNMQGKQRKQVMKTMFNDYRDAGLPAGIDEITGRVVLGDQQNPMWNIYGNKYRTEPDGYQLRRMLDDYKIKDTIELAKQSDAKRMIPTDPEPYTGRNESIRRLTDMSNNIKEKGLGYDPLPNRQGPIQNVFDNGNTNIEPMTKDSNVISFMDYLKRKGK
jgi:hypothetical protein